jgi:hypothetical protein
MVYHNLLRKSPLRSSPLDLSSTTPTMAERRLALTARSLPTLGLVSRLPERVCVRKTQTRYLILSSPSRQQTTRHRSPIGRCPPSWGGGLNSVTPTPMGQGSSRHLAARALCCTLILETPLYASAICIAVLLVGGWIW